MARDGPQSSTLGAVKRDGFAKEGRSRVTRHVRGSHFTIGTFTAARHKGAVPRLPPFAYNTTAAVLLRAACRRVTAHQEEGAGTV